MGSTEKCALCGSSGLAALFEEKDRLRPSCGETFRVAKCPSCGLVCTLPYVDSEGVKKYYPEEYYSPAVSGMSPSYGSSRRRFSGFYSRALWRKVTGKDRTLLSALSDLVFTVLSLPFYRLREKCFPYRENPGKFLDVGCGAGRLLAEERALGWETYGVEPGEKASAYARKACKLDIFVGELRDAGFPGAFFDVISLRHVLEHFIDPVSELREISGKLKPGGILVIKVPNLSLFERTVFGKRWWAYELPRHRFHFDGVTVKKVLERAGFRKNKVYYLLNLNNMILSMRNFLEDMRFPRPIIGLFNVDNKVIRAFFLPLAFLLKLSRQSGEMLVYGIKGDEK